MKLRPAIVVFVGEAFSLAEAEYRGKVKDFDSLIRPVHITRGEPSSSIQLKFEHATQILDAGKRREAIAKGLTPDEPLGQLLITFVIDADEMDLLPPTLSASLAAFRSVSFDVRRLQIITILAGPADRGQARQLATAIHSTFSCAAGGGQTGLLLLLPWYDGALITSRPLFRRLAELICVLFSLSQHDPVSSAFSQFRNGQLPGQTFMVGLRSYVAANVRAAAELFFVDAAWNALRHCFNDSRPPFSIAALDSVISTAFPSLMEDRDVPLEGAVAELKREQYRKVYLPTLIQELSDSVSGYHEFLRVLNLIAEESKISSAALGALLATGSGLFLATDYLIGYLLILVLSIVVTIVTTRHYVRPKAQIALHTQPKPPVLTPNLNVETNALFKSVIREFCSILPDRLPLTQSFSCSAISDYPLQEAYDSGTSEAGKRTAEQAMSAFGKDVVTLFYFITKDARFLPDGKCGKAREFYDGTIRQIHESILKDFDAWTGASQSADDVHRWILSERMQLTDLKTFVFKSEPIVEGNTAIGMEACYLPDTITVLYLVPLQWTI